MRKLDCEVAAVLLCLPRSKRPAAAEQTAERCKAVIPIVISRNCVEEARFLRLLQRRGVRRNQPALIASAARSRGTPRHDAAETSAIPKSRLHAELRLEGVCRFAPIRMVFHSRFVVQNLIGRTVPWHSQEREDAETGWREAVRHHGLDTLFASAWGAGLYWLNPAYFWWVTPIIVALILSVPLSVFATLRGSLFAIGDEELLEYRHEDENRRRRRLTDRPDRCLARLTDQTGTRSAQITATKIRRSTFGPAGVPASG